MRAGRIPEHKAGKDTAMSIEETDRESAAVAISPTTRVSLEDIRHEIAAEYFTTGRQIAPDGPRPLDVLTVCILVMQNGFTIIGKAAPADEKNFNAELGRKFAREDAIRQAWPLMGYALRERLRKAA
jgi:hypothetical protein